MVEPYPWYGVIQDDQLQQGDLLTKCPNFQVDETGLLTRDTSDVIIVSHSCDLANDKLDTVQVCPYWGLEDWAKLDPYLQSKRGREDLRRGNLPGYHLLNRCQLLGFEGDFLVIDFRSLYGVNIPTVRDLAQRQSPRLRLLPPYREHLAQAFARFFMRVGLPIDVPPFR